MIAPVALLTVIGAASVRPAPGGRDNATGALETGSRAGRSRRE
jgi:hypothetical protein